jgi:hypothetical protein
MIASLRQVSSVNVAMRITQAGVTSAGLLVVAVLAFSFDHHREPTVVAASPAATVTRSGPTHLTASGATFSSFLSDIRTPATGIMMAATSTSTAMHRSTGGEAASPDEFRSRHRLMTVSSGNSKSGIAIVDCTVVKVGETIDGFQLVSVSTHAAEFTGEGGTARLELGTKPAKTAH